MSELRVTPELCVGQVMHHRFVPAGNRFVYPLFYLRLPLSQLDALRVPLLGINRFNLIKLDFRDYGARDGGHPLPWVRGMLKAQGLDEIANGEVVLQTFPRLLGYVFNPVSFWFCHDAAGALRAVLAEVSNTFGERHNYIVAHPDARPIASEETLTARKVFHVSPFFPVSGEYRFLFRGQGDARHVRIDYHDNGERVLATSISGRARALTGRALAAAVLRFPFMTLGVITRIHLQALKLWRLRVPFYRKPQPPLEETTR